MQGPRGCARPVFLFFGRCLARLQHSGSASCDTVTRIGRGDPSSPYEPRLGRACLRRGSLVDFSAGMDLFERGHPRGDTPHLDLAGCSGAIVEAFEVDEGEIRLHRTNLNSTEVCRC